MYLSSVPPWFFTASATVGQIKIHRFERFARGFVEAFFRRRRIKLMFADEFRHALLRLVGERGETAHIGEKHGDFAARAAERKFFRAEQFVHDIRRNDFGENRFDAALFAFFKHDAVGDKADMFHQNRAANRKDERQPEAKFTKTKNAQQE